MLPNTNNFNYLCMFFTRSVWNLNIWNIATSFLNHLKATWWQCFNSLHSALKTSTKKFKDFQMYRSYMPETEMHSSCFNCIIGETPELETENATCHFARPTWNTLKETQFSKWQATTSGTTTLHTEKSYLQIIALVYKSQTCIFYTKYKWINSVFAG